MKKEYYYLDVRLDTLQIISSGTSVTATLTGKTNDPQIHRVFLTKGQYNKLQKRLTQK